MAIHWAKRENWQAIVILCVWIALLVVARLLWNASFHHAEQPHAVGGVLDLRDWDTAGERTIALDGEWEFYPEIWLAGSGEPQADPAAAPQWIRVPGGWNDALQEGKPTPYGYGSYRLRILVDPGNTATYSIRMASVRSASELYVNGRLLYSMGQPGASESQYEAGNLPYTASFQTDGTGVIEVVLQAANFSDIRSGGIVRSASFGTEAAIFRQTQLSITMQQLVAIVFLVHAFYAFVLFLIGDRNRSLFFFSLLVGCAMFANLLASEEKVLHYWFFINYEWGFRLILLAMSLAALALLQCVYENLSAPWRRFARVHAAASGLLAVVSLAVPVELTTKLQLQWLVYALIVSAVIAAVAVLLRVTIKDIRGNLLLLLSYIAFMSHFSWWIINMLQGVKTVYYPFDLIVSIAFLATLWFKQYIRMYTETKLMAAKLREADKLKDEFLANTSHELRNPLHSILNVSQAVLERERGSIELRSVKDLETVLSVGKRMSLMLNDLLDAMSLKEGAPRLHMRPVLIQTIAGGVLDMLRTTADGKAVRLVNAVPAWLPPVFADENRVIQIMFNLLHNAVKFTPEGEIAVRVEIQGAMAVITVTDTGIGMDGNTLRRAFEPYEQARGGQVLAEGGFGLGLSISKQLVELQGGEISASSVPGQGSSVSFTLPLAVVDTAEGKRQADLMVEEAAAGAMTREGDIPAGIDVSAPAADPNRPRLLIVDDDPVNLDVLEAVLGVENYYIGTAISGEKALEMLNRQNWDLVIADVMMPRMSGYELTRSIRERFALADLPVLLLTARTRPEDVENGFLAGANDYVSKPVEALELRSRVRALAEVKHSVHERLHMEAAWLQAQIQPHFLFNTLNSVMALSTIDIERMNRLLEAFSAFLRDKFRFQDMDELVPIEDELAIVRAYLYIEKERFEDRLQVEWDIEESSGLKIPLLTVQPLAENAVRHGIAERAGGGKLTIRIVHHESHVEIAVEDNGIGMDESYLERLGERRGDRISGVGLWNTNLRLKRFYGQGLRIVSKPGEGTKISFVVRKSYGEAQEGENEHEQG